MYDFTDSATIYLSQTEGCDDFTGYQPTADGYGNGPVKTLDRVMFMIHSMRVAGVMHPVTVCLTEDYYTDKSLVLGCMGCTTFFSPDGHKYDNITFTSYGDKRCRFIGGKKLTGFEKDTFNGVCCLSLFIPEVKDGKMMFTDLYVNGRPAKRTRYPKEGLLKAVTTEFPDKSEPLYNGSRWFVANKEDLENIDGIENSTVNFYHYWIDEHTPVESYDRESGKLVLKNRARFNISVQYEPEHTSALKYYLENIPQTFSDPGQWYLDVKNGKLYYIPENDNVTPDSLEVFAPTADTLVKVNGKEDNKAAGIRLENLEFVCTKGDYISKRRHVVELKEGESGYAADEQAAVGVHGTVEFEYAEDSGVFDCKFTCVGGYGVNIKYGCDSIRVEGCEMTYLGGGGIKIYGAAADEPSEWGTGHCIIRNNKIYKGGMRHAAACGITVCHSAHNEISDNDISYLDYSGISVGWVWGYRENPSYGNIIKGNTIHHIGMGRLSDMGGIYLLGRQSGTVVEDNIIHDVKSAHYGGWGIYTDEGSSFITVRRNVVYNTKTECFHQHYGSHNTVRDNLFAFGGNAILMVSRKEEHSELIIEGNTFITDGKPIYAAKGNGVYPNRAIKPSNNRIWDVTGEPVMFRIADREENLNLEGWQKIYGMDMGSRIERPDSETMKKVQ